MVLKLIAFPFSLSPEFLTMVCNYQPTYPFVHLCLVARSCLTLRPQDYSLPVFSGHASFPSKNAGTDCHFLLRNLPNLGFESTSLASHALADEFFTTAPPGKPSICTSNTCLSLHLVSLSLINERKLHSSCCSGPKL